MPAMQDQIIMVNNDRGPDDNLAATHNDASAARQRGRFSNHSNKERLFNMRQNMMMRGRRMTARGRVLGRNGTRGRSSGTRGRSGSGGRSGSRNRGQSGGRSRSRDRSRSGDSRGENDNDSRGQEQRKGKLMSNYDRFQSSRRSSMDVDRSSRSRSPSPNQGGGTRSIIARSFQSFKGSSRRRNNNQGDEEYANGNDRRRGPSNPKQQQRLNDEPKLHPWILPPHLRLAPRIDIWFAFAISSCASIASIGQIHASTPRLMFSSLDNFALSTCALSFIFSFVMALGMRYAPSRKALTKTIFPIGPWRVPDWSLTVELVVLSVLLLFWMIAIPVVVSGNAEYSANREVLLAMAGSDIWNANLFYSSWASFLLCAYLWVEVVTLTDRRGTLNVSDSPGSIGRWSSSGVQTQNVFAKRWALLFLSSVIVMSASIFTYTSPSCQGALLKQTPYCSRALMGILVGGLLQIVISLGVAALYRLSHMSPGVLNSHLRRGRNRGFLAGSKIMSIRKRNLVASVTAVISLIVQAVNAAFLTSPTGGGPGNISGTLYFGSWLGLILAFELCLRYLELYSTSTSRSSAVAGNKNRREDATVYEEDSEEEESLLMLRTGAEGGKKNRSSSSKNMIIVEDASLDSQEDHIDQQSYNDQESYIFSQAARSLKQPAQQRRRKSDSPPADISANQHFGGGVDPEEYSTGTRSRPASAAAGSGRSLRSSTSSDGPVGSIDVRSATYTQRSRSGEEAKGDPDGTFADRKSSYHFDSYENRHAVEEDDDYGDLRNSDFFADKRLTSFHMEQVEKLDEIPPSQQQEPPQVAPSAAALRRVQGEAPLLRKKTSTGTNLSPLEEGSGEEISPNTGSDTAPSNNPSTVSGGAEAPQPSSQQRVVGDNLRTMQAMRGVMHSVQQADRSKKSGGTSSKKSSVGASSKSIRSRDNKGLASLHSTGFGSSRGGGGQNISRHSRQSVKTVSTFSRSQGGPDSVILTDHSEQGGSRASSANRQRFQQLSTHDRARKSPKSRHSASTLSSRGVSTASVGVSTASFGVSTASAILTDDEESGSNPPPTISDGMSTKDDLSGFSVLSTKSSVNRKKAAGGGPPPPPFRRSKSPAAAVPPQQQYDYNDTASQYSSSAPVRSIHTNKSGESDTIVSDPTLDAGLDQSPPPPKPRPKQQPKQQSVPTSRNTDGLLHHHSSSTNSYDKKYSDETSVRRSSESDEGNPSSHEGGGSNKVVDTIVAAALAYAEKTHGESDNHGFNVRGSGTTASTQPKPGGRLPQSKSFGSKPQQLQPSKPKRSSKQTSGKHAHRASTGTQEDASSSIHSFYTESDVKAPKASSSAPVEDLVAKALSHAQGQLEGQQPHFNTSLPSQQHHQPQRQRSGSKESVQYWGNSAGKSVGSMYSEETEFTNQDAGLHFDC